MRRAKMANDVVSSTEEMVVAASASWAVLLISEEDVVSPSISGAASSIPDKLDLFMDHRERCAHAEEKHREAPISAIHFKEETVEDQENAGALVRAVCSVLVLGGGAAFLCPSSPPSREKGDFRCNRSPPSPRASHKWRMPVEFDDKVPWEAYQA
ncbi:hypothetical protein E2C01_044626 [Portunus trituberculatus]|uniref:Uncharacterized protein n=1 Tax=Portunus trituberculatus TaxID=210409 RepID=A0A5B7FTL4_PORTR|nr:hypothetical protein [Portunus trituberculatus]